MLEFIKVFLLSILLFGTIGCGPGSENKFKYYSFENIFYDENTTAYILEYVAPQENIENSKFMVQENDNYWTPLEKNIERVRPENIIIKNNVVKILDENNSVIFMDKILLTSEDVEEKTGVKLPKATMVFSQYISGSTDKWDRKSYIVNIGTETAKNINFHNAKSFTKIYCFYISKQDDIWNIKYIDERPSSKPDEGEFVDVTEYDLEIHPNIKTRNIWLLDKKFSMCHNWDGGYGFESDIRCFMEIDDNIVIKKLFGDIAPKQYEKTINKLMTTGAFNEMPTDSLFFINDKKDLHVFYNDKEVAKGEYFLYQMYTKENPTTPVGQQKIYTKGKK